MTKPETRLLLPTAAMNSSAEGEEQPEQAFQTMYTALWKKPLDTIFHDVPATNLQYIPPSVVAKLRLEEMNCRENVLLVREEYTVALNAFEHWSTCARRGGGVVVRGQ